MRKLTISPLLWSTLILLTATLAEASVTYTVNIDTSTVSGTSGFVDFQFNPGNAASQAATATITNFSGGTLGGAPAIAGNVAGTLPAAVTFTNSTALNEYFQQFTFGSKIFFQVTLSGPAVDAPNGTSTAGSSFFVGLYDSAQNPILTNQGALSGAVFQIDVNLNGTTTATAFPTATNGPTVVSYSAPRPFDSAFQVSYAANPSAGESYVNVINTGANGASLLGPGFGVATGNTCVNVYAFSPDEQLVSCCSCLLTPNAVANLGVNRDLTVKTLTGVVPSSVVIKLVNTLAGPTGAAGSCNNSAAAAGGAGFPIAAGMVAYGTTQQQAGAAYNTVEHTFVPSTLSPAELASITGRCASIIGNGSGYGICQSCRAGALGGEKR